MIYDLIFRLKESLEKKSLADWRQIIHSFVSASDGELILLDCFGYVCYDRVGRLLLVDSLFNLSIVTPQITTLEQLRDYINYNFDFPLDALAIIQYNHWVDDTSDPHGICHDPSSGRFLLYDSDYVAFLK